MSDVLELGWEEWLALPALGLPSVVIRASNGSTGATSALVNGYADVVEQ